MTKFQQLVYQAILQIPAGKVSTYNDVAASIGKPGSARAVGNALNKNPFAPDIPCHRVVPSDGSLGGFARGSKAKREILEKEGIVIQDNKLVNFDMIRIRL